MSDTAKKIFTVILVVFIFFFGYNFFGGNTSFLTLDEQTITIQGADDYSASIPFDSVARMELRDSFDRGEAVSGGEKKTVSWGLYKNEELGEYDSLISSKIGLYLVITAKDGSVMVLNYESEDATSSIFTGFVNYYAEEGMEVEMLDLT